MPLYEYHCPQCDSAHELLVRSEDQAPACPACGAQKLQKLLSVCASPATGGSARAEPAGPCGSACGCFPAG
ncbi:FmdB family zinc ribbon protein [Botrimarina hoheduenensis]|uniref:Zinc ribbon domain protein n=1 Tax=Botrimarina hoheduenensis TaxID=2528000 RepID=A0A5C5WAR2_9BACT|nr:zinc ribbon domain-containing protein [Botrimarina hoheduenensis]TWT47255.1 Zinc ribbon domain protein [Botrimarina hoheduenensis]